MPPLGANAFCPNRGLMEMWGGSRDLPSTKASSIIASPLCDGKTLLVAKKFGTTNLPHVLRHWVMWYKVIGYEPFAHDSIVAPTKRLSTWWHWVEKQKEEIIANAIQINNKHYKNKTFEWYSIMQKLNNHQDIINSTKHLYVTCKYMCWMEVAILLWLFYSHGIWS